MSLKTLRNFVLSALLVIGATAATKEVSAASCNDIQGGLYGYVDYTYCGEFFYENEFPGWMVADAAPRCVSETAYYYWSIRVTGFDQPAYYDGAAICG